MLEVRKNLKKMQLFWKIRAKFKKSMLLKMKLHKMKVNLCKLKNKLGRNSKEKSSKRKDKRLFY